MSEARIAAVHDDQGVDRVLERVADRLRDFGNGKVAEHVPVFEVDGPPEQALADKGLQLAKQHIEAADQPRVSPNTERVPPALPGWQ